MAKRHGSAAVNGEMVKSLMAKKGWYAEDLVEATGLSKRAIQKVMAGKSCSLGTIKKVADAFNKGTEDLFAGKTATAASEFKLTISLSGIVSTAEQFAQVALITPQISQLLAQIGVQLTAINSTLQTEEHYVIAYLESEIEGGIYCYLKVPLRKINGLWEALQSKGIFCASEHGEIIAAQRGKPTPEIKAKLAESFPMFNDALSWDEFKQLIR